MDCGELLAAHSTSQLSWNDSLQVNDILGATQGGDTWEEVAAGASQSLPGVAAGAVYLWLRLLSLFLAASHS